MNSQYFQITRLAASKAVVKNCLVSSSSPEISVPVLYQDLSGRSTANQFPKIRGLLLAQIQDATSHVHRPWDDACARIHEALVNTWEAASSLSECFWTKKIAWQEQTLNIEENDTKQK